VEFAKAFFDAGILVGESAIKAAQERLRPILMTSIAFVVGTLPLAFAAGAGAASRIAIGTAVVGGMLSATMLAIFLRPGVLRRGAAAGAPAWSALCAQSGSGTVVAAAWGQWTRLAFRKAP